ncbi:HlyD family secretion protein [Flammeovirga sp. EKP202]|uniref:HlyD family secretion protein n=1 Tax=Flammeovirga sp. EKP202 TaxID=2770592 RepID=UPI00165FE06C|nr:efflux RND transporter periplasmic adaptor subunit [Flammeovirga sp. EKP202]MBD0403966.1 efflux RND transporter periplasmic adaptor subunit [Flammeovirga sp. EKP202]
MKNQYIFIALIALLFSCEEAQQTELLKGKVKREVVYVSSKIPGRINQLYVEEGEKVQKGDTLATIDMPELGAKEMQAKGAIKAAKAQYEMAFNGATSDQLDQVTAAYNAAKEQYTFAEKSYQRIKAMHDEELISDQRYDEVFTKYQMAKAKYEGTEAKKREVEKGVRNEKQRMALGQLERAKGAMKEVEIAMGEQFLIAPKDMSITSIALQEGELALPGYNIFSGYETNSTYFRFVLSEEDVLNYKVNQKVQVTSPFDESIQLEGKILSIKEELSYANRKSMNPNYKIDQSLYVLKVKPLNASKAEGLLTNTTLVIKK